MSPAKEIPGFYYDQVRNKYFRIQPNHRAPDGAAHSVGAIKAKKEATAIEQTRTEREDRERKGRIRRYDPANFTALSLALRIGKHPRGNLPKLTQNYVSRFQKNTAELLDGKKLEGFTITPNGQLYTMMSAANGREPYMIRHSTCARQPSEMAPPFSYQNSAWASLASVADRYLLCTYGSTLICAPLHGNDADVLFVHNRYLDLVITDIASSPDMSSLNIALASDNGLYIGQLPLQAPPPRRCDTLLKEQVVVTFKDSNIVMSGERSGHIHFTDVREPSTVHRLQHSSAANGIAVGRNQNHIIVSGLGTIALYDLRYTKAVNPRKRGREVMFHPSKPLVPFHVPRSHKSESYSPGKSLAYSPNLDMAVVACQGAAPQAGHTGGVLLYNASTGQIIDSPVSGYGLESMRGVAIARVRDGPESIFVGEERRLHEYRIDGVKHHFKRAHPPRGTGVANVLRNQDFSTVSNLAKQRFPLDAQIGMAEKWRNGDHGPG